MLWSVQSVFSDLNIKGCLLSPCLFNLCTEHMMQNVRLDELQAGIKIAGRNINLR